MIIHVDLDAYFAAVEQRDKPSLRARPVVVGGLGARGVVATASYEARRYGIGSAMPMAQARALCPHAAFLAGRFDVYRAVSSEVMETCAGLARRLEPVSLDEAYLEPDLGTDGYPATSTWANNARAQAHQLRRAVHARTGLDASVGVGTSKLVAKLASSRAKPDGVLVVAPGAELSFCDPLPIRALPGVGPATETVLRRLGLRTVADLRRVEEPELVALLGSAHGAALHRLSRARDDRTIQPEREQQSVSVEDTFATDVTSPARLDEVLGRMVTHLCARLHDRAQAGRTVSVKVRYSDFRTLSRSSSLPAPTDERTMLAGSARALLASLDIGAGVRLLGVSVSGLCDWRQGTLFVTDDPSPPDLRPHDAAPDATGPDVASEPEQLLAATGLHRWEPGGTKWQPGQDVHHPEHGRGWVWGSGKGIVTVRFETRTSGPGPVRSIPDDGTLTPAAPTRAAIRESTD